MLPVERQKRITEIIQDRKNVKISELSSILNVSEMTIHRDLKPLLNDGVILKTFGGVTLKNQSEIEESTNDCVYCCRTVHEKMGYRLILPNKTIEKACCAHCGLLRHRQLGNENIQAICHDFFKQTTISAPLASYVMDTSINMGCCQPQVLTFEWKEHAEKFVKGFGGDVYSFKDAMETVFLKMNGEDTT